MNNNPNDIIVDTSALIAFFLKSEINHPKAKQFARENSQFRRSKKTLNFAHSVYNIVYRVHDFLL